MVCFPQLNKANVAFGKIKCGISDEIKKEKRPGVKSFESKRVGARFCFRTIEYFQYMYFQVLQIIFSDTPSYR